MSFNGFVCIGGRIKWDAQLNGRKVIQVIAQIGQLVR